MAHQYFSVDPRQVLWITREALPELADVLKPNQTRGNYLWLAPTEARPMDTARLFQSGRSQAVRLPKAYRFSGTEVIVKHFGNGVLLLPMEDPWLSAQPRTA